MREHDVRCVPVSETSVMLYLADTIDVELATVIGEVSRVIQSEIPGVREVTPSYTSILVEVGPYQDDFENLAE